MLLVKVSTCASRIITCAVPSANTHAEVTAAIAIAMKIAFIAFSNNATVAEHYEFHLR